MGNKFGEDWENPRKLEFWEWKIRFSPRFLDFETRRKIGTGQKMNQNSMEIRENWDWPQNEQKFRGKSGKTGSAPGFSFFFPFFPLFLVFQAQILADLGLHSPERGEIPDPAGFYPLKKLGFFSGIINGEKSDRDRKKWGKSRGKWGKQKRK